MTSSRTRRGGTARSAVGFAGAGGSVATGVTTGPGVAGTGSVWTGDAGVGDPLGEAEGFGVGDGSAGAAVVPQAARMTTRTARTRVRRDMWAPW